jgi:hypothetical protein
MPWGTITVAAAVQGVFLDLTVVVYLAWHYTMVAWTKDKYPVVSLPPWTSCHFSPVHVYTYIHVYTDFIPLHSQEYIHVMIYTNSPRYMSPNEPLPIFLPSRYLPPTRSSIMTPHSGRPTLTQNTTPSHEQTAMYVCGSSQWDSFSRTMASGVRERVGEYCLLDTRQRINFPSVVKPLIDVYNVLSQTTLLLCRHFLAVSC